MFEPSQEKVRFRRRQVARSRGVAVVLSAPERVHDPAARATGSKLIFNWTALFRDL